jgi:hypothetical protein
VILHRPESKSFHPGQINSVTSCRSFWGYRTNSANSTDANGAVNVLPVDISNRMQGHNYPGCDSYAADGLIRGDDPTGEQQLFDIAITEVGAVIQPDPAADDAGREAVVLIAVR